jgi:hypothetical protein
MSASKRDVETGPAEPMCLHLRSKNIFVAGELDPKHITGSDGHCWCNLTQRVFGPSYVEVGKELCNSKRSCYEPVG